ALLEKKYGTRGSVGMGDKGLWLQGGKETLRKELIIATTLSEPEKIKVVRDALGITTDEEFKKKKGHVYRLIHRAESNNGKAVYFPGYHSKK
ncbi:MAG: hypothetical protein Q8R36_03505, partial [bacterium]|nr:hypothetical protein [bacterium]